MSIEEPIYTIETKTEQYEIRIYNSSIVAETKIESEFEEAGNNAFKILASYIFGNNTSKLQIAMTAPVTQKLSKEPSSEKIQMTAPVSMLKDSSGYLVQFAMPNKFNMDNIPTPNDTRVKIVQIPQRKVAVYKYSGSWSMAHFEEKLKIFKLALTKDKVKTVGEPIFARFNSPYQIWFLRRNEIWLELEK